MAGRVRAVDRRAVEMRRDEAASYFEVAQMYAESASHGDWKTAGANAVLGGIAAQEKTRALVTALERLVRTLHERL